MKLKISRYRFYVYFVVIAFLFPRGFGEINNIYHIISSLLVWIAVFLILLNEIKYIVKNIKIKINRIFIYSYFVLAFLVTLINRGEVTTGLQQIIAAPFLCIFMISNMHRCCKTLLETIMCVFMVEFTLNFIFKISQFEFGEHLTFLGHVQMISQFGIVSILVSILYWMAFKMHKRRVIFLVIITLVTMFTTDASSAILSAIALCIAYITYKWKLYHLFCFRTEIYLIGMNLLSLMVVYVTSINRNIIPNLDFSGRRYVWIEALVKIINKPLFGYGIDGVLLQPFWTEWTGGGFNYAHNQILQNMLDGGVFLTISFWIMIYAFVKNINKLKSKKYVVLFNATMISFLFIMIFDSTTLYCYMYFALAIIYAFSELEYSERNNNITIQSNC